MFSDKMIEAMTAQGAQIGYAAEIDFITETSRIHSGIGKILIAGNEFLGTGELGSVGTIQSVGDNNPSRVSMQLSGLPSTLLQEALNSKVRGRDVTLYIFTLNSDGKVSNAEVAVAGMVVNYQVTAGANNTISIEVSDEFELYENPWNKYWSPESHSVDKIGRYVGQMSDREISWGSKSDAPPFRYE